LFSCPTGDVPRRSQEKTSFEGKEGKRRNREIPTKDLEEERGREAKLPPRYFSGISKRKGGKKRGNRKREKKKEEGGRRLDPSGKLAWKAAVEVEFDGTREKGGGGRKREEGPPSARTNVWSPSGPPATKKEKKKRRPPHVFAGHLLGFIGAGR